MSIFEIFQHDFMIRALVAGGIVGFILPVLGVFLVMRRASMLSETISHGALAGVGFGLFLGLPVSPLIIIVSIITALCIEFLVLKKKIFPEAVHALFLSGGLAVALLLTHFSKDASVSLEQYLFGSIITVQNIDILFLAMVGCLALLVIIGFWWKLLALSFDDGYAAAMGLNTSAYSALLAVIVALIIAMAVPIIGGLLIGALIVIPVLSAARISKSFKQTAVIAAFIGLVSVVIGLLLAYLYDLPASSAIVIINIFIFVGIQSLAGGLRLMK